MAVPNPPSVRGSVLLNQADFPNYVARSPTGVWVVDSAGCTRYANDALARMLGYSAIEMLGRPFFDFMEHEERKLAEHYLQRRTAGVAETHQFQFRRRDDGILSALISGSQIEVGSEVMYLAHVVDLGHVLQHRRDHAIIEQNFERLIMHSPYAIAMTTLDGTYVESNRAYSNITGYSPEELRTQKISNLIHPLDLAENLREIERLRTGGVRQPEQIGSFILGTSRMMAHSERRVARRREALGLTQGEVAERLGSSQSRVAKMEAAHRTVSTDLMLRALFGLGVSPGAVGRLFASGG